MNDIHSCSYYCDRPACIKAQRDELRAKYESLVRQLEDARTLSSDPTPLINAAFKNRLAQAIEQMPFGDTAASFAIFIRNFK